MALEQLRKLVRPNRKKPADRDTGVSSLPDPLAGRILPDSAEDIADRQHPPSAATATEMMDQIQARIAKAQSVGTDAEACLREITFPDPVPQSKVLDCLRTFGVAIFPSIYEPAQLARVKAEYEDLIENGADLARDIAAREETPANSYALSLMRERLAEARFPEVQALFGSATIQRIAEYMFAGQEFDFNSDLFLQWTDHTDAPASGALHWDKQLTLKSWLYVTDALEGDGAMRAGAGTAAWMRYLREDAMFDGIPYGKIRNQVEEQGFPVVSTGGPAGTFFLFMTDTAHGATPVAPGHRRNIIRARSRPKRILEWSAWANKL